MKRILCTFPGRAGDLLWALPTVRAISETLGHPVDLQIAGEFKGLLELLALQPYLGLVFANPLWSMSDTWEAPGVISLDGTYDRVIHLGYRRWPELALPFEVEHTALDQWQYAAWGALQLIDLSRPWITVPPPASPWTWGTVFGFSDCYFELKFGLMELLFPEEAARKPLVEGTAISCMAPGSRWVTEGGYKPSGWLEAAQTIVQGKVFLGDCSALHVLACALGKPCVLVEPMEARWNPIFYPLGMDGRVKVVKGLDGLPTFDARHTADVLREVLSA